MKGMKHPSGYMKALGESLPLRITQQVNGQSSSKCRSDLTRGTRVKSLRQIAFKVAHLAAGGCFVWAQLLRADKKSACPARCVRAGQALLCREGPVYGDAPIGPILPQAPCRG